jgi:integrase
MRKPFYRASHGCWYVKDGAGRFIRLDPDETKAHTQWAQMLDLQSISDRSSFAVLAEAWLQEHVHLLPESKLNQVGGYLAAFLPAADGLAAIELTPGMVAKWLDEPKPGRLRKNGTQGEPKTWKQSTRRDAAAAIKRVMRWAHGTGRVSKNPLFAFSVSEGPPRAVTIDSSTHSELVTETMKCVDDKSFGLFLIAMQCGARPQQIREVTRVNVLPDCTAWAFASHKTAKRTGRHLKVYLNPCLQTLTRILLASRCKDHLFTTADGDPWKKNTAEQRFRRLRKRLKLPDGLTLYAYRHTFATESLLAGSHIATVSALMGHTDTRMVSQRYGHLDQHSNHLLAAVRLAAARRYTPS